MMGYFCPDKRQRGGQAATTCCSLIGDQPILRIMHYIIRVVAAAVVGTLLVMPTGRAFANDSPSPSASATPTASATPNALDTTLTVDGMPFTVRDLIKLLSYAVLVYTPPGSHPSANLVTKAQSEMPSYDPDVHYVSNATQNGQVVLTVWQSDRFAKSGNQASIQPMLSAAVFGLLDAGLGEPSLQALYQKERDADTALGPTAPNPLLHRHQMSDQLAVMIINLMEMLNKKK